MTSERFRDNTISDENQKLYAEQVRLLYKNAPVALIASLINSAVLAFILLNAVPHKVLATWLVCIVLIVFGRHIQLKRFLRITPASLDISRSGKSLISGVALSGLAWGSAGIFLFPDDSITYQAFLTFVLGGMAIGAAVAYAVIMRAFIAYMVPSLTPIIIRFLFSGDEIHIAMGGMSLLFALLITVIAMRINRMTIASLRLRFENASLISYLTSAKDDQEKLNKKLVLEIAERRKAEDELNQHREHLEELVNERTDELTGANTVLQQEIAERRRAEKELARSEVKYRHIFQTVPLSIWEEDFSEVKVAIDELKEKGIRDFRAYLEENPSFIQHAAKVIKILDVNKATLKMYGAKGEAELCSLDLGQVFEQESYSVFKEALIAIAEGRTYFEAEVVNKTLQGKRLDVLMTMAIPTETSEFRNLLVCLIDITERKKLEEELQRSQKLESIGMLAGGIAHDFNNLLTAILNNLFLIKMHVEPEGSIYERTVAAEKASMRAQALTNQLLTFSKGGAPIKELINIGPLLKESVSLSLRGSNVECKMAITDDLWHVEVDPGQMTQVINNIIINADQSMPEGGIMSINCENVTVGAEKTVPLKEGEYIRISIKDQGIGISEEHISRVFDPYFTTKQKGSGLGLSTSYSIINRHDGHIDVESELGVGTVFNIYLPASMKKVIDKVLLKDKPITSEGKVLIMDDEELVRDSLGRMIESIGYSTEFASDGKEAVEIYRKTKAESRPFDVVIMDMTIPGGMGGKEAIQELRVIDPNVKAIVSSGYSYDPIMANFKDYGFKAVLSKPYKGIMELSQILDNVIKGRT